LNASALYPYGSAYNEIPLFRYGYLGVEFFFVISGFVISMTLATSKGPRQFLVKRMSPLASHVALLKSHVSSVDVHPESALRNARQKFHSKSAVHGSVYHRQDL
jgi:hypothetical protein